MKLNIHQIFEQISADIFVIKEQNQNSCTITRVRKFLPETTIIDSDTLYLMIRRILFHQIFPFQHICFLLINIPNLFPLFFSPAVFSLQQIFL